MPVAWSHNHRASKVPDLLVRAVSADNSPTLPAVVSPVEEGELVGAEATARSLGVWLPHWDRHDIESGEGDILIREWCE